MKPSKARPRPQSRIGLTVIKKVSAPFSQQWIGGLIASALASAGYRKKAFVGIVFTGNAEIKKLNKQYRGKDCTTDVLSFEAEDEEENLGDIVISVPCARSQAKAADRALRREIADLIIHGTLHLLGHDHMKKKEAEVMFALQDKAMKRAGHEPIDDKKRP